MQIHSMGIISAHGRGMNALEPALEGVGREPACVPLPGTDRDIHVFSVPDDVLKDKKVLKGMRRADRLSKMAVLAASDAWNASGLAASPPERIGVLLATGLGPHVRTFKFLDGILDYGDLSASPTDFSHSVHNAACSYITSRIGIHGPVQTLTDFDFAFQQSLRVAQCWLEENRCDVVLAGTAEELGAVLLHVCDRMLDVPSDGRINPLAFSDTPRAVPGEGAVFFTLTRHNPSFCGPAISVHSEPLCEADLIIHDAEGLSGPEHTYSNFFSTGKPAANFVSVFGSMMTGSAMQCAIAAQMLSSGICYGRSLNGNNPDISTLSDLDNVDISSINCLKRGKDSRWQTVRLQKSQS